MEENDDYFKIGNQLLAHRLNSMPISDSEENQKINDNLISDGLHAKCYLIYRFFLSNGISSFLQPIAQNLKDQLDSEIENLLEMLESEGKSPSIANFQNNITRYNSSDKNENFFSYFDALNLLSFSLLLIRNNEKPDNQSLNNRKNIPAFYDKFLDSRSDEIVQNEQLKEKYKRLLTKLKEYESIFSLLANKMNLPENSDFNTIASELALFNFSNDNNNNLKENDFQENKLKRYLIHKFNISNESSIDNIIKKIEMDLNLLKKPKLETNENKNSIKSFFIQMLDMPENSDDNDVKIKIGSVLDEINTMKSEINFLNTKLSTQKKQNLEALNELEKLKRNQFEKDNKKLHVSFNLNTQTPNHNQNPPEQIKPKKNEGTNPDIYILTSEVESLKACLENAREKTKTIREQNKILKKVSKEAINESRTKTNTITELTIKVNELILLNNELKRNLDSQTKDNASTHISKIDQSLSDSFDYLSSQVEKQSNELSLISENRNILYAVIHKQEKVIDFLHKQFIKDKEKIMDKEKELIKAKNENNDLKNSNEIQLLEKRLILLAEENKRPDIIEILTDNDNNGMVNEKVSFVSNKTENIHLNQIVSAFSLLLINSGINDVTNKLNIKTRNVIDSSNNNNTDQNTEVPEKVDFSSFKEVCEYLQSLLVFFDKIANSSEALDWIFSNNFYIDNDQGSIGLNLNPFLNKSKRAIREALMNIAQRITYFLEDKQISFVAPDFLHITDAIFSKYPNKDQQKNKNEGDNDTSDDSNINRYYFDNSKFDINFYDNDDDQDSNNSIENEKSAIEQQRVFVILTVADVLKNYSHHLEERVDELGINLQELRDELIQAEMATNDSKSLLDAEQRKNRKLIDELNAIKSELRDEKHRNRQKEIEEENKTEKESTIETTDMFTNDSNNITAGLNNDSNRFYRINRAITNEDKNGPDKSDEDNKKYRQIIKAMKKKFEKVLKNQEKKINVLSDKLIDTKNELESTKEVNNQITKENKDLTETMAVMTERLSQFEIEKDAAVTTRAAELENDYEEKLTEQKNLNSELLNNLNILREKVELAEDSQNIENKNLQDENKKLYSKIEEIKANYESLIESYKQKYIEFTEREKKLSEENLIQNESLKKLNKELNDARIESKISALKNKTLNEKIERQESLHIIKTTAISANFEANFNEKLKMVEIEYENRQRNFLNQIFEQLKDFYDFSQIMNEENCIKIVSKLVNQLKAATIKVKEMKKVTETLDEMKSELHVKSDSELITKVLLISSLSNPNSKVANADDEDNERYFVLKGEVATFESSLKNWRKWANFMNSILSDNFSSYSATSAALAASIKGLNQNAPNAIDFDPKIDSELRSKVEEKILSAVGRRLIFRRIEILRNEKIIFLKLLNEFGSLEQITCNERSTGLQTLICIVISVRRIQKISGKLPSISLGNGSSRAINFINNNNSDMLSRSCSRYSYTVERNNYSSYESSSYDDTYEKNSNSDQQKHHKKKPIISCS